jgi:hypothetical protein
MDLHEDKIELMNYNVMSMAISILFSQRNKRKQIKEKLPP